MRVNQPRQSTYTRVLMYVLLAWASLPPAAGNRTEHCWAKKCGRMKLLNQQQNSYLEKRRKFVHLWHYVGPLLLIGILGFATYLFVNTPLLINPYEILSRLESHSIKQSSLEMMAVLLPIMFIVVCFLLIVLVAIMYAAFSNEKKYLEIVDEIKSTKLDISQE